MQDPAKNKETAKRFLTTAFDERDPERAIDLYVGETYTQHSPTAADGKDAFLAHARKWLEHETSGTTRHARIVAEDDLVVLHSELISEKRDGATEKLAIVDIYRFDDDGKIIEHWDVIQEIPPNPANNNGAV